MLKITPVPIDWIYKVNIKVPKYITIQESMYENKVEKFSIQVRYHITKKFSYFTIIASSKYVVFTVYQELFRYLQSFNSSNYWSIYNTNKEDLNKVLNWDLEDKINYQLATQIFKSYGITKKEFEIIKRNYNSEFNWLFK